MGEVSFLTVTDLTLQVKDLLERSLGRIWVVGEIASSKRPGMSGHLYFDLKDAGAKIAAVVWRSTAARLKFELRDGLEVLVGGRLDVYLPQGNYKLVVDRIEPRGLGAQDLALRQLKEKLQRLGWFAPETKKPLPRYPRRIALVTSPTGAAVRDMLEILGRRWPAAEVWVCPVRVQGAGAVQDIVRTLNLLDRLEGVDVVILGRGGGSRDDLSVFNDEQVAAAIHHCRHPLVSAVGHEIDVTIADLVADRRALTPSEAAEIVAPDGSELLETLQDFRQRMDASLRGRLEQGRQRLRLLEERPVLKQPERGLRDRQGRLDELQARMERAVRNVLSDKRGRIELQAGRLASLSPLHVLGRGYSLTRILGETSLLRRAEDLQPGQRLETLLLHGRVISVVEETIQEGSPDDGRGAKTGGSADLRKGSAAAGGSGAYPGNRAGRPGGSVGPV